MSLAVEEIARREAELREDPNKVPVRVRVHWDGNVGLPRPDGEREEKAIFNVLTFGDHTLIEQACHYEVEREDGKKQSAVDYNEVRRLVLKRNLMSWTLSVPIERENGWLTHDCYARVGLVSAPVIEALLDAYWERSEVRRDEEELIARQAAVLFGKNSRGVIDACEAVRLYCNMSAQWDKFGVKQEELDQMPYKKYVMLKLMLGHEGEATRRQIAPKNAPVTKIAGRGGRTRPSRGQRIPL